MVHYHDRFTSAGRKRSKKTFEVLYNAYLASKRQLSVYRLC